jgi:hypothetical protein
MKLSRHTDFYIIGLGVSIPEHSTVQAIDAMSCCFKLFSIVQEPVSLWLPSERLGKVEVINLLESYVEGSLRTENYGRAAEIVLKARSTDDSIGYVTYV